MQRGIRPGGISNSSLTVADFDGDGASDLLVQTDSAATVSWGGGSRLAPFVPDTPLTALERGANQVVPVRFFGVAGLLSFATSGMSYRGFSRGASSSTMWRPDLQLGSTNPFTPDVWVRTDLPLSYDEYALGDLNGDYRTDLWITTPWASHGYYGSFSAPYVSRGSRVEPHALLVCLRERGSADAKTDPVLRAHA